MDEKNNNLEYNDESEFDNESKNDNDSKHSNESEYDEEPEQLDMLSFVSDYALADVSVKQSRNAQL